MFNVGGGEVLVILVVALLVLGPSKLPEAARQIGNVMTQVRQMSSGFQNELKSAMDTAVDPAAPPQPRSAADDVSPDGAVETASGDDSGSAVEARSWTTSPRTAEKSVR